MTLPEKFAPLAPWFARHRRDCWLPVVEDGDGDAAASKFSGNPWLAHGEPWPTCGSCEGPMSLFLQLDLATVPAEVRGSTGDGLLQAYFCTQSCCIHGPDEGDPLTDTHLLRVVDPNPASGGPRTPPAEGGSDEYVIITPRRIIGWERHDDYPSMAGSDDLGLTHTRDRVTCPELGFAVAATLDEFFESPWSRCNEKLGGWPCWANISTAYPDCPECGRRMDHMIFQFGYGGYIPVMFGDGGQGHVVHCSHHPRVLAYPWTCG